MEPENRAIQKWDEKANRDLLVAMFEELSPSAAQMRGVIARVHAMGYTYTIKAANQHLQKLRRKDGPSNGTAPSTPAKKTPTKATGSKSNTGKRKKGTPAPDTVGDDDTIDDMETPTKKPKMEDDGEVKEEPDLV